MKHIWKQKAKCNSCNGTGIHRLGEKGKVGIVCRACKGTGCREIKVEWEDFDGKIRAEDIKRVVEVNPGVIINEDPKFGGMPYEDWFDGKPFPPKSENRKNSCPALWYQSVNYKFQPDWEWCKEVLGSFSSCPHWKKKDRCWERWDEEFGGKRK